MLDDLETVVGNPLIEKYISDFIFGLKELSSDIGQVIIVYNDIDSGGTTGMGNIAGVKDMNRCVEMLENYVETLKAGIPALH